MVATSRVEIDADAGIVRFKPLMKTDEHRRYNCTATNDVGYDSNIGQLSVLGGWMMDISVLWYFCSHYPNILPTPTESLFRWDQVEVRGAVSEDELKKVKLLVCDIMDVNNKVERLYERPFYYLIQNSWCVQIEFTIYANSFYDIKHWIHDITNFIRDRPIVNSNFGYVGYMWRIEATIIHDMIWYNMIWYEIRIHDITNRW